MTEKTLFTPNNYQTLGQWTKGNQRALCLPPRLRFIASVGEVGGKVGDIV